MTSTESSKASESGENSLLAVEDSLRQQSMFLALARVLKTVFAIAVPIVLVRVLDQTTFGHYKQVGLVALTAVRILTLGIPGTLFYFVPRSPTSGQSLLARSAAMLTGLGIIGGLAIVLSGAWLDRVFSAPLGSYRVLLALIVVVSVPASLAEVVAVVDRRARISAIVLGGLEAVRASLVVAVALLTREIIPVLTAVVLGITIQLVATWVYIGWRKGQRPEDRSRFATGDQLRYTLPFYGAALIGMVRDQVHSYFVATQYASAQFAIYAVGTMSIPFVGKLTQSVAEIVVIDASKNFEQGNLEEIRRVWGRATASIALILVPMFTLLEVFATDMITFVFGADYRSATPVFRVFSILILFGIPLSSAMLRASANLRTMVFADVMSLLATVGTLALSAKSLGPIGAVLSLVAGNLVFNLIAGRRIAVRLGIGFRDFLPWRRLAQLFATSAFCCGLALLLVSPLPLGIRAILGPALGVVFCGLGLWFTPMIPESERVLVKTLLGSMGKRLRRRSGGETGDG